jgi:hypothetical protein
MNQKVNNFSTSLYISIQTLLSFLKHLRFYVNYFHPVNLRVLLSNKLFIYILYTVINSLGKIELLYEFLPLDQLT